MRGRILATACLTGLAGCNFAPAYHRPAMDVPANYQDAQAPVPNGWSLAHPNDAAPRGEWWNLFRDPQLSALEGRVQSANQNIAAAVARFDQARAQLAQVRAQLFPSISAAFDPSRLQNSKTVGNVFPNSLYNSFYLAADFNYELDLWGSVRNQVAQARFNMEASQGDLATVDLDSHADLATDYFTLRGDDTAISVYLQTVKADQTALQVVQNRFDQGDATESDLDQSRAQLANTETQLADERLQRATMEHAIAILVGAPPAQFRIPFSPMTAESAAAVPAIDVGIPSQLLERRPDVAAAERRVMAANANIGVARAAFFPTVSLSAIFGVQSRYMGELFEAPSQLWSLGANTNENIFNGGATIAGVELANAQRAETIADYRNTVLGAFRDVEDNLVALQNLQQEALTAQLAAQSGGRALAQAQNLYQGGLNTFLDVLVPQTNALQEQLTLAQVQARRLETCVLLIKALGGGWNG